MALPLPPSSAVMESASRSIHSLRPRKTRSREYVARRPVLVLDGNELMKYELLVILHIASCPGRLSLAVVKKAYRALKVQKGGRGLRLLPVSLQITGCTSRTVFVCRASFHIARCRWHGHLKGTARRAAFKGHFQGAADYCMLAGHRNRPPSAGPHARPAACPSAAPPRGIQVIECPWH